MPGGGTDPVQSAFLRLLQEASQGPQARVDALVALSQRTVLVVTWALPQQGYRTLVNAEGHSALPVFTDVAVLRAAAKRFRWLGPGGEPLYTEIGAREAIRFVSHNALAYLVVDIGAPHALEVTREELEPLVRGSRSDSAGPFAAVGRISSTMLEAATRRSTPTAMERPETSASAPVVLAPPPAGQALPPRGTPGPAPRPGVLTPGMPAARPIPATSPSRGSTPGLPAARPLDPGRTASPDLPPARVSSTGLAPVAPIATPNAPAARPGVPAAGRANNDADVTLAPVTAPPSDALLQAISDVLRSFPEVEWASFCLASRGGAEPQPTIGLRVDAAFRQRVGEIAGRIEAAAVTHGMNLDVVLLDDPQLVREARHEALLFFPWRKRPTQT